MALKRASHKTFDEVSMELDNIDRSKEPLFVSASRAPTSSDKTNARIWFHSAVGTFDVYFKNPLTGAWLKITPS